VTWELQRTGPRRPLRLSCCTLLNIAPWAPCPCPGPCPRPYPHTHLTLHLQSNASAPPSNAVFDHSGNFVMYPTLGQ
jgi:hypothetical protein